MTPEQFCMLFFAVDIFARGLGIAERHERILAGRSRTHASRVIVFGAVYFAPWFLWQVLTAVGRGQWASAAVRVVANVTQEALPARRIRPEPGVGQLSEPPEALGALSAVTPPEHHGPL